MLLKIWKEAQIGGNPDYLIAERGETVVFRCYHRFVIWHR